MKKFYLVWMALLGLFVVSGCKQYSTDFYRVLDDNKYFMVSETRYEYDDLWMEVEFVQGGYNITYSGTNIYTFVAGETVTVHGYTCDLTRLPTGLYETDCDEASRQDLMRYVDSSILHEQQDYTVGGFNWDLGYYLFSGIFLLILTILFGLLGYKEDFLVAAFRLDSMFKFRYTTPPEHAQWYIDLMRIIYRIVFWLLIIAIVVLGIYVFRMLI